MDTYQTYKAVFDASPDAIIISDDSGLIVMANQQAEKLFGYKREELVGKDLEIIVPQHYRKRHVVHRKQYGEHPEVREMGAGLALFARRRDGTEFPVEISLSPIELPGKTLVAAAVRDVSERKKMEADLIRSEERMRNTLDNMLEGAMILDYELRFLYVNKELARQGRYEKDAYLGRSMMELYAGFEHSELFQIYTRCLHERCSADILVEFPFADRSSGWFELSIQPVPEGLFILSIDRTERKKAELLLEQSEKNYRLLFNSNPQPMWVFDIETLAFLNVNDAAVRNYGYSREEFLSMTLKDIRPPESLEVFLEHVGTSLGNEHESGIWIHTKKDGTQIFVRIHSHLIDFNQRKARLVLAIDVTAQLKAEEAIAAQKKFTEDVLNHVPADIAVFDPAHRYLFVNAQAISDPALRAWMIGKEDLDYCRSRGIDESLARRRRALFEESVHSRQDVAWVDEYSGKSGASKYILRKYHPVFAGDDLRFVIGYGIDITDRRRAELLREQSEQRYRQVVENISDAVFADDARGRVVFANKQFLELFGFADSDLAYLMLEDYVAPEYRAALRERHNRRMAGEDVPDRFEYEGLCKDGSRRWVEVRVSQILENGQIIGTQSALRDITYRKNAEIRLQAAMETIRQTNTDLEQFAYMVSHDLQEPLRMVTGFLNLLQLEAGDRLEASAQEYIRFAVDGAERMKILIQDLLQYSRVGTNQEDFTPVPIGAVLDLVVQVLKDKLEEAQAEVIIKDMPVVAASKTLMDLLFMNLVANALKYRGAAVPRIEIGCSDEGDRWQFYVQDNGIGIAEPFFEKIFVVFQRLHSRAHYAGTGIGLAICKKIVEKHGGTIWVESTVGRGSTFYFTLKKQTQ